MGSTARKRIRFGESSFATGAFATEEAVEIFMESREEITSVYMAHVWYLFPSTVDSPPLLGAPFPPVRLKAHTAGKPSCNADNNNY
jgi:hypothetical protein